MKRCDVAVIGLGSAGEAVAAELASGGKQVVGFEPHFVGGECPFTACMPSKAMLHLAHTRRRSTAEPSWSDALDHRETVVDGLDDSDHARSLEQAGVEVVRHRARLSGANTIVANESTWVADHVIIATGSGPVLPPIEGLERSKIWTAEDALTATELPGSLAIIGGGPVGCELSDIYAAFGSDVTVLEQLDRLVPDHDAQVASFYVDAMRSLGVDVRLGTKVSAFEAFGGSFRLRFAGQGTDAGDSEASDFLLVDRVIVAAGQQPRLDDLGLESVGLTSGEVPDLDAERRSVDQPWLFILGDANSSDPWTHGANRDATIAARSIGGQSFDRLDSPMPRCTFTDPATAHVGLSAEALEHDGRVAIRGTGRHRDIARFSTDRLDDGLVVVTVDRTNGRVAGASAVGPLADELIATATAWVHHELAIEAIASQVFAFPTISQVWEVAIADAAAQWRNR